MCLEWRGEALRQVGLEDVPGADVLHNSPHRPAVSVRREGAPDAGAEVGGGMFGRDGEMMKGRLCQRAWCRMLAAEPSEGPAEPARAGRVQGDAPRRVIPLD